MPMADLQTVPPAAPSAPGAAAQLPAPLLPPAPPPMAHDVTIVTKRKRCQARVEGVPPEEFGIARNARNIRDSGYCFHEVIRREADLIAEGFDAEQVRKLPGR